MDPLQEVYNKSRSMDRDAYREALDRPVKAVTESTPYRLADLILNGEDVDLPMAESLIPTVPLQAKLVTRPIQGSGNRFLNYFAGTRYQPVTRTVRIDGGAMANSPAEAAEIASLAKGKGGEEAIGVKQATKKLMKPRHHLREYTSPMSTSQGDGLLREVRPVDKYWKIPEDAYKVKFDTGVDRVRPDFESMPKAGSRVPGSVSTEIIMNPR